MGLRFYVIGIQQLASIYACCFGRLRFSTTRIGVDFAFGFR